MPPFAKHLTALLFCGLLGTPASADVAKAEHTFWNAALASGNATLVSAYLLHFPEGAHASAAATAFEDFSGHAWTPATAAEAAWRDPGGEPSPSLSDAALTGGWVHNAECDINFLVQDIAVETMQVLAPITAGVLAGETKLQHSDSFHGMGQILAFRHQGTLATYLMRAENNVTGTEVHIGVLTLAETEGQITTRGWEMNTAGAYCDVTGRKE